ncbi:UNVERIFIED_CONTAM: hypothetical protein Scaly_1523800 [Sesamum calycinum]|uniref:Mutator-like transposase n=1 Tax=Sesamum calycinum TaxID=2727403 RepID=A0AAW2P9H8_9LAMI
MMQMAEQALSTVSNANADVALASHMAENAYSPVSSMNAAVSLASHTLSIGQEFPDVDTCRRTLKDIAIALHFEIRIVKSDRSRFIAKCSKEGCPWRVHVANAPESPLLLLEHFMGNTLVKGSRIFTISRHPWVGLHGLWKHAWRGKERSMAALHGTYEEGFKLLPAYCEQIRKTNPGSIASVVATGQDNSFQRLFVSYRAAIYGFINACRPLLELDRVHLKGKYLGTVFCAAAVDADDALFPLAIAIVDVESDENWMWFMSELRKLLGVNTDSMPRLTILSERTLGMVDAVETHFPNACHGFCLRYISENFRDTFKNSKLVNIFWNAVYALTTAEFESKISEMVQISQDVLPWLHHFNPQLWAVAYFEGSGMAISH